MSNGQPVTAEEFDKVINDIDLCQRAAKEDMDLMMQIADAKMEMMTNQIAIAEHTMEKQPEEMKKQFEQMEKEMEDLNDKLTFVHRQSRSAQREQFETNYQMAQELENIRAQHSAELKALLEVIEKQNATISELNITVNDMAHPYKTAMRGLQETAHKAKEKMAADMEEINKQLEKAKETCRVIATQTVPGHMRDMRDSAIETAVNAAKAAVGIYLSGYAQVRKAFDFLEEKLDDMWTGMRTRFKEAKEKLSESKEAAKKTISACMDYVSDKAKESAYKFERFVADVQAEYHISHEEACLDFAQKSTRRLAAKIKLLEETDKELFTLHQRSKAALHAFKTISTPYVPEAYKPSKFVEKTTKALAGMGQSISNAYLREADRQADKANLAMDKSDILTEQIDNLSRD